MAEIPFYNLKGSKGAYERIQQKKKEKMAMVGPCEESTVGVTRASPILQSVRNLKRGAPSEAVDWSDRHVVMRFPADASAYTSFGPISAEVGKMVLPGDRAHLDDMGIDDALENIAAHSFLGTEGVIYLRDKMKELRRKLEKAVAEQVDCVEKNNSLKQYNGELEKVVKELKAQLASRNKDAREFQATLAQLAIVRVRAKELESEVKLLKDNIEDVGLKTKVLIRGEMCQEYIDGKTEHWDATGCIKAREELLRDGVQAIVAAQSDVDRVQALAKADKVTAALARMDKVSCLVGRRE